MRTATARLATTARSRSASSSTAARRCCSCAVGTTTLLIAAVILVGTWQLLRDSLHLMFDGVPSSIDLDAVCAEFEALPGVDCIHDLHVWATGTTQVVLTAYVVMPAGHPDDSFFRAAAARMKERFAIGHVTLQAATETL